MKKGDPTLNNVTFSINWLEQESWIWVCNESGRFEKTSLYIPKIKKKIERIITLKTFVVFIFVFHIIVLDFHAILLI